MSWNEQTRPARRVWEIDRGWDVFSFDGHKIGAVAAVLGGTIVVEKGLLFKSDLQIPVSAIADVANQSVHLSVTKDEIPHLRWDAAPAPQEEPIPAQTPYSQSGETASMTFPLAEERLQARRRPVAQGQVHLQKRVREEDQSIDVPLRQDVIRVERRLVSEPFGPGTVPAAAFQELDIEIPLRGEEALVRKQTVLREEVHIHKAVRTRDQTFSGTVRREEVHVEPDPGLAVDQHTLRPADPT